MSDAILVTGGAGYIGSHTCKALKAAGFTPVTYDNLSLGRIEAVRWGPLVLGDTRDEAAVSKAISDYQVSAVIHFAALSSVGESESDPSEYYSVNVGGLMGVLDGMARAGCKMIVFSSTAAVYGQGEHSLLAETHPRTPVNVYGRSKLMCELILDDHHRALGLNAVCLRYFNASGADESGETGEFRMKETHLIPRAMMSILGHLNDFEVFGADFPTEDGTAIRDYVHVSDLAEAHVLALRHLIKGGSSGAFNLGTGKGHSVGEVLRAIEFITGRRLTAPSGSRRSGDPTRLVADPTLAKAVLGFFPHRSTLNNIVKTAWQWHQRAHPEIC